MKILRAFLFSTIFICPINVYANNELPEFSKYPIQESDKLTGEPSPVDISSYSGAQTYKTKLLEGAQGGPNFAGHYTVVAIGCGTQCEEDWVIDAKTGKIIDKFSSIIGVKYQLNSKLLIINPPDAQLKAAYEAHPEQPLLGTMKTIYEVLEDGSFNVISSHRWADLN
ncbi:MAG: hypothetical protein K2P93_03615 [Alphaproteobacteria bacterium]|nr:hypothetical protein [Alphaproteobacteria bacterium]